MRESFSLLYHSGDAGEVSPFDKAIVRIARGASLRIAAPFIGLRYLERVIGMATDWRLLSDVEAWLRSTPGRLRWESWQFIRENLDRIHHVRALHAKVVVSAKGGYVGSANLTPAGILGKTELGVFIESEGHCRELEEWFDQLWGESQPPVIDETSELIRLAERVAATAARSPMLRLSSRSRAIRASLVKEGGQMLGAARRSEDSVTEAAVRAAIDEIEAFASVADLAKSFLARTLAGNKALSLAEVAAVVRARNPEATLREIHDAVVVVCANHYSTAFLAECPDIAVIAERGLLRECTPERLLAVVGPFDGVLTRIIQGLSFSDFLRLPPEEALAAQSGIPVAQVDYLVAALIEAGLLVEQDMAGVAGQYRLEPGFDWPLRFNRYRQASGIWQVRSGERRASSGAATVPETSAEARKGEVRTSRWELRYGRLVERTVDPELVDAPEVAATAPAAAPTPHIEAEPPDGPRDTALAKALGLLAPGRGPRSVEALVPAMIRGSRLSAADAVEVLARAIQAGLLQATEADGTVMIHCDWKGRPSPVYRNYVGTLMTWKAHAGHR